MTNGISVDELEDVESSSHREGSEHEDSSERQAHSEHEGTSDHDESEDDEPDVYDRIFGRLLNLYVFESRYECHRFRQAVILQLQRCNHNWGPNPGPTMVKRVLPHLDIDDQRTEKRDSALQS